MTDIFICISKPTDIEYNFIVGEKYVISLSHISGRYYIIYDGYISFIKNHLDHFKEITEFRSEKLKDVLG